MRFHGFVSKSEVVVLVWGICPEGRSPRENSEWPKQQPMISKQNHENKCYKVIIIIHYRKRWIFDQNRPHDSDIMMKIRRLYLLTNGVVCYVKVILTNQKYPLIINSAQLITFRGKVISASTDWFAQWKTKEHFGAGYSGHY